MSVKKILKESRFLFSIVIPLLIGCVVGVLSHDAVQSSNAPSPKRLVVYLKFPGELFIRMLKMIIVPLVASSIIAALADIAMLSAGSTLRKVNNYLLPEHHCVFVCSWSYFRYRYKTWQWG